MSKPNWLDAAACRGLDTDVFFPSRGEPDLVRAAKDVCRSCAVIEECLDYALANGESQGVWGGRSERERREIRRRRRASGWTPERRLRRIDHGTGTSAYQLCRRANGVACVSCRRAHASAVQRNKELRKERAS